jgi:cysteinyl-tRNA synthetase
MRIDIQSDPVQRFQAAMDDDFNTSSGVAVLFELAKALSREGNLLVHQGKTEVDAQTLRAQWQTLVCLAQVLGLAAAPELDTAIGGLSDVEIDALIQQRQEARKAKNFAESDRIRDELKAQGITLVDQPGGITTWHPS